MKRNRRRSMLQARGATISETAEIGECSVTGHKSKLSIGDFTFIGKAQIALHDETTIGNRVCINDGVQILTASHDVQDSRWGHTRAPIVIEDYVWVATNAIILPGVRLGRGSVVGAGAVVAKSVPAGCIVVGNPACATKTERVAKLDYNPCEFLAANRAWLVEE